MRIVIASPCERPPERFQHFTTTRWCPLDQKMSDQKNYEDDMSLPDRPVVIAALVLISSGLLGSFFMTQTWQLVLLWGVVVGFGTGMTVLVLGATVATRWFSKRRGLVVGLMTASNGTGQLVFLPLLAKLSGTVGWRAALGFVLFTLVLALVAVALLMRDHPDEVGLAPYGGTERVTAPPRQLGMRQLLLSPLVALREASKTATFWALFFTFYVCGFSTNGWLPFRLPSSLRLSALAGRRPALSSAGSSPAISLVRQPRHLALARHAPNSPLTFPRSTSPVAISTRRQRPRARQRRAARSKPQST